MEVKLPPLENYDWDAVYYYMVSNASEAVLYGGGRTIRECRKCAQDVILSNKDLIPMTENRYIESIHLCNLDEGYRFGNSSNQSAHSMMIRIGEFKIYLYAERIGYKHIRVTADPYMHRKFMRYTGRFYHARRCNRV